MAASPGLGADAAAPAAAPPEGRRLHTAGAGPRCPSAAPDGRGAEQVHPGEARGADQILHRLGSKRLPYTSMRIFPSSQASIFLRRQCTCACGNCTASLLAPRS